MSGMWGGIKFFINIYSNFHLSSASSPTRWGVHGPAAHQGELSQAVVLQMNVCLNYLGSPGILRRLSAPGNALAARPGPQFGRGGERRCKDGPSVSKQPLTAPSTVSPLLCQGHLVSPLTLRDRLFLLLPKIFLKPLG